MQNLWQLTLAVAREVRKGGIWEGTSTAATTTTITDATIGLVTDAVAGGTIWLHDETPVVSRLINNLSAVGVVDWTAVVAALAGAQLYTIFGSVFPRHALRDAVNRALQGVGEFASYITINSVNLQEDYTLPATVTGMLQSVEVSAYQDPTGQDNAAWGIHYGWTQFDDTLRFLADPPLTAGTNNIRLGFNILHPALTTDVAEIRREVSPIRLKWEAVAQLYMHLLAPRDSTALDEASQNLFNRASQQAGNYPPHKNEPIPPSPTFLGVGSRGGATSNPDLVS